MFIVTFFNHKLELPHKLSSFGFGFLVPIFFIYVGSTLSFSALADKTILTNATLLVITMVIIRIISALNYIGHLKFKDTILLGLGDSMPLTFLVAIATLSYNAKAITENEYYTFIIAAMMAAVSIMLLIKILHSIFRR
jgi:Kef-type K+ transport system membrane component KefB